MASSHATRLRRRRKNIRRSCAFTAARSGSSRTASARVAVLRHERIRRRGRESARLIGTRRAFAKAIWADWGHQDAQDVLAAVDTRRSRHRRSRAPRRRRLELRRILTDYVIAQDRASRRRSAAPASSNILAGYGTDHTSASTSSSSAAVGEPGALDVESRFPSSTPTASPRRRSSSAATRTSTSRCSTPSRCTRPSAASAARPSS